MFIKEQQIVGRTIQKLVILDNKLVLNLQTEHIPELIIAEKIMTIVIH